MHRSVYAMIAVILVWTGLSAQSPQTGFVDRTLTIGAERYGYQVYIPRSYAPGTRLPIILSLHGGGEAGLDGLVQTEVGFGSALRRFPDRFAAVVVFPQCRPDQIWASEAMGTMALRALEAAEKEYGTDPDRVYLTGLSRGGQGSWWIAYRNPDRFAALLVIAGRVAPNANQNPTDRVVPTSEGDPHMALARKLRTVPTWIFHGEVDATTPVEESRKLSAALRQIGAPHQYTEMPGSPHNVWDNAYRSPGVAAWLFNQRRTAR